MTKNKILAYLPLLIRHIFGEHPLRGFAIVLAFVSLLAYLAIDLIVGNSSSHSLIRLGTLDKECSSATIKNRDHVKNINSGEFLALHWDDEIKTTESGLCRFWTESGAELQLEKNSSIVLKKVGEQIHIQLKTGQLQVLKLGNAGIVYLINGKSITPIADILDDHVGILTSAETSPPSTSLSSEDIFQFLEKNRGALFKCYAGLLQRRPGASGDVMLNFTIEATGKVSEVSPILGNLDDADFRSCLKDVVSRIIFNPFRGSPINGHFPLHFD